MSVKHLTSLTAPKSPVCLIYSFVNTIHIWKPEEGKEEEEGSKRQLCTILSMCPVYLIGTNRKWREWSCNTVWEMCGPRGAEFEQLSLTDLPRLLKHYSQNPTSPGSVCLPCGELLAFKWDGRIFIVAELRQKIDHACSGGEALRKLCISAVLCRVNVLTTRKNKKRTLTRWRS